MSALKWLDKNLEYFILAVFLVIMTVLAFANVVLRYCFHNALSWSDEVCCYCLALSAFVTLPCSIRNRTIIKVDTFTSIMPEKVQKILGIVCNVIVIVFLVFCVKGGIDVAANAVSVNQTSPALQIPVAFLYYFVTACFALAIFRTIQVIREDVKGRSSAKIDGEGKADAMTEESGKEEKKI